MYHVKVNLSKGQLGKLKSGKRVRVMKGDGFNLIVKPSTYDIVSKSFSVDKPATLSLDREEMEVNQQLSDALDEDDGDKGISNLFEGEGIIKGCGIFGHKVDRIIEKSIGKKNKKALYEHLKEYKIPISAALNAGVATTTAGLSLAQPELAPFLIPAAYGATAYLSDYLDEPSKYQGNDRARHESKKIKGLVGEIARNEADRRINNELGTNYGYLRNAGLDDYENSRGTQMEDNKFFRARSKLGESPDYSYGFGGRGVHGFQEYVGRPERMHQPAVMYGKGTIRHVGGHMNPALVSKPEDDNFQFRHTIAPYLMEGHGLYTGRGLYG